MTLEKGIGGTVPAIGESSMRTIANTGPAVAAAQIDGNVNSTATVSNCTIIQNQNVTHFHYQHVVDNQQNNNGNSTEEHGLSLRIITRTEWLAKPPKSGISDLELPSQSVIIAHTVTKNSTQADYAPVVRSIQENHMSPKFKFSDIGYNFLIGGDGSVYEGRGWDYEGDHTKGYNKRSICIAFIGTFDDLVPSQRQLNAASMLIAQGVYFKKIKPDYQLYCQTQLKEIESHGKALYRIIKTWRHWTEKYIP